MMTHVPEKLKLNQFKDVNPPSPRAMLGLHGFALVPSSQYTGEDKANFDRSTIGQMVAGQRAVEREAEEFYNEQDKK